MGVTWGHCPHNFLALGAIDPIAHMESAPMVHSAWRPVSWSKNFGWLVTLGMGRHGWAVGTMGMCPPTGVYKSHAGALSLTVLSQGHNQTHMPILLVNVGCVMYATETLLCTLQIVVLVIIQNGQS